MASAMVDTSHPPDDSDDSQDIDSFISRLSLEPENEQVVSELGVLQSIYGDEVLRPWKPRDGVGATVQNDVPVRYEVHVELPSPHDDIGRQLRILVSLPRAYPASAPPQMQLLSRYIGAYKVDSTLFGSVLRTFISRDGVDWAPESECVFDGVENIRERCGKWYGERLSEDKAHELQREDEVARREERATRSVPPRWQSAPETSGANETVADLPSGVRLVETEPLVDRKSLFIGRACRITHPLQVPVILAFLMSDRHIARATHPIINAWRCKIDGVLHQDNDDDGETAAGGRLAHLLQILGLEDVLVVVTRFYGGVQLGPDRFKHINHVARNALELGGFLDSPDDTGRRAQSRLKKR